MIRVVVADDQAVVRTALAALVSSDDDIDVVGHAANGQEAVILTARHRPDVVLMDVRMPVMDGIEATRRITAEAPGTAVLVLTTYDLDEYVVEALRVGASGFLLKDTPAEALVEAVRVVASGDAVVAPSVTRRLLERFARLLPSASEPAPDAATGLTERERDVLLLVARGMSNAEIAEALVVSETTVKTHVSNVLTKLGLRDRVQAVVFAYESGLVSPR